jgi:hypothetical protein
MMNDIGLRLTALLEAKDSSTIEEMRSADHWQDGTITEATQGEDGHWSLSWTEADGGGTLGCSCPPKDGVTISAGDSIRVYSPSGFGSQFHGIDVNGVCIFWLTPLERIARDVQRLADHDRRQREAMVTEAPEREARYEALLPEFKARIDRFRQEPEFRARDEAYELFCVSQANTFAVRAREAAAAGEDREEVDQFWSDEDRWRKQFRNAEMVAPTDAAVRWLCWWWSIHSEVYGYDYQRQKALMPGMEDGHSGNTFGGACSLARAFLEGHEL